MRNEAALAAAKVYIEKDFPGFCQDFLKVRSTEGGLLEFKLNECQLFLHEVAERQLKERGYVRIILLKGRQFGGSTYIESRLATKASFNHYFRGGIISHEVDSANEIAAMMRTFYSNLPEELRPEPKKDNPKAIQFSNNNSSYYIATAGNKNAGHSQTLQFLHGSEVGLWANGEDQAAGILQTVHKKPGTEVWLEGTSGGPANWFHDQWNAAINGESDYEPIFIGWLDDPKNPIPLEPNEIIIPKDEDERALFEIEDATPEQLKFRRKKIAELGSKGKFLFKRQYPTNPIEAFSYNEDGYLSGLSVLRAAENKGQVDISGATVMGVDPAYKGKDSSAICIRKGNKVIYLKTYFQWDNRDMATEISRLVQAVGVDQIFIDIAYGTGIYEMTRESGIDFIEPVNFGSSPMYNYDSFNRRAEMAIFAAEWLEGDVKIPNDQMLLEELPAVRYDYKQGKGGKLRLILEDKELVKKRLKRSPDRMDSFLLTFARPVEGSRVFGEQAGAFTGSQEIND